MIAQDIMVLQASPDFFLIYWTLPVDAQVPAIMLQPNDVPGIVPPHVIQPGKFAEIRINIVNIFPIMRGVYDKFGSDIVQWTKFLLAVANDVNHIISLCIREFIHFPQETAPAAPVGSDIYYIWYMADINSIIKQIKTLNKELKHEGV